MTSKKLNIGIFTYDFYPIFGGQGRHIYNLYKQNQEQQKMNMYVFSPNLNELDNHVPLFTETQKSRFKNIEHSLKIHKQIEQLIEKYELDIVHLHGGPGGIFLFKKLSIPVIYTSHHTYWQQYKYIKSQSWKYFFYLFEKKSYQFADKIICVSHDTQNILEAYYNIDNERLLHVPNGVEIDQLVKRKGEIKQHKNILYVGRIDKRKGVDFLVHTMQIVKHKDPNISLFVVGEGKDRKKLEKFSKRHHLPITFYGHLSDEALRELYEKTTVQIVPSIFEGFGISVLEGMAQGVPVIATNVDGMRGVIKHYYSGILTQYGDRDALAEAIIHIIDNPSLQKRLITNAYKELPKYNWKEIYYKTIQEYQQLAQITNT